MRNNPSIWGVLRGEFVVFGRFDGSVFLIVFDSKITESRNIFDIRWSSTATLTKIDKFSEDFFPFGTLT